MGGLKRGFTQAPGIARAHTVLEAEEEEKPERAITDIVTIHPTTIFGPAITPGHTPPRTFLESMKNKEVIKLSEDNIGFVDVRDVAQAHIQAIKIAAAKNRRFIVSANNNKFKSTMELFFPHEKKIRRPITEEKAELINPKVLVNNHASRNVLKMFYKPLNETYMDMIDSLRYNKQ